MAKNERILRMRDMTEALGVSNHTVYEYVKKTGAGERDAKKRWTFTSADLMAMRKHKATHRPGRPKPQ